MRWRKQVAVAIRTATNLLVALAKAVLTISQIALLIAVTSNQLVVVVEVSVVHQANMDATFTQTGSVKKRTLCAHLLVAQSPQAWLAIVEIIAAMLILVTSGSGGFPLQPKQMRHLEIIRTVEESQWGILFVSHWMISTSARMLCVLISVHETI